MRIERAFLRCRLKVRHQLGYKLSKELKETS